MAQAKTTTKKSTGMTREEQSKELFKNIREYNLLGFRIGDGLRNMFDTLVRSISKKKASVHPIYTYTVHGGTGLVVFNFGIKVARKKDGMYSADVVVNKEKPGKSGLYISSTADRYPFSEQGIKDLLKEIKVVK